MPIHPRQSREAHPQIGLARNHAAVSDPPQPDSLAPDCDLRGHYPVAGRDAAAGQPFPLGVAPGPQPLAPRRHVLDPDIAERFQGPPHHLIIAKPDEADLPAWPEIGLWVVCFLAVSIFLLWLNHHAAPGVLIQ